MVKERLVVEEEEKRKKIDRKLASRPEGGKKYLGTIFASSFQKQGLDRDLDCKIISKRIVGTLDASCYAALRRCCSLRCKPLSLAFLVTRLVLSSAASGLSGDHWGHWDRILNMAQSGLRAFSLAANVLYGLVKEAGLFLAQLTRHFKPFGWTSDRSTPTISGLFGTICLDNPIIGAISDKLVALLFNCAI